MPTLALNLNLKLTTKVTSLQPIYTRAAIAQLGERQTEDLKVPGSIPGGGTDFLCLLAPS